MSQRARSVPRRYRGAVCLYPEVLEIRLLLTFDPTPVEQEIYEDLNRMRANPQAELNYLFTSTNPLTSPDPEVNNALAGYGVTSANFLPAWQTLTAQPPLAFNAALHDAAVTHDNNMIAANSQQHVLPGEQDIGTRYIGYNNWTTVGENIYAYSKSAFYTHSAFAIDWGNPSLGHRLNMMGSDSREVGVGVVPSSDPAKTVGPLVVTEDFGARYDQGDPFLVGVVYDDQNVNARYDAGEGRGGVTIQVSGTGGTFTASTLTAGMYQLQVPAGTYTVTATGGGVTGTRRVSNVVVGADNVKVDLPNNTVVDTGPPHIVRMNRVYNPDPAHAFHHFTTSGGESNALIHLGWHDETTGLPGFAVYSSHVTDSTPIHRVYNVQNGQHYLTIRDGERDYLVALPHGTGQGWGFEKDEGELFSSQLAGTTPIYVLYNNINGEHFYTPDAGEVSQIVANNHGAWVQQTDFGFAYTAVAGQVAHELSARTSPQVARETANTATPTAQSTGAAGHQVESTTEKSATGSVAPLTCGPFVALEDKATTRVAADGRPPVTEPDTGGPVQPTALADSPPDEPLPLDAVFALTRDF